MNIVEVKTTVLSNGNTFQYAISDRGTAFTKTRQLKDSSEVSDYTDEKLWTCLDNLIYNHRRARIWYGDKKTGRSWNEEYDVTGRIGRSGGTLKCPLIIHNSRSFGGPALLDGCIIRIDLIDDRRTIYCHDNFHTGDFFIKDNNGSNYRYEVWNIKDDGTTENVANFAKKTSAINYIAFMKGERYSK